MQSPSHDTSYSYPYQHHPRICSNMSSFSNPTEFFGAMPCPSREGLRTGDPCINPALFCVPRLPTGDPTLDTTVARVQLPLGPQTQLSTYEARPHGAGLGGHVTIQRTHRQDRGNRNMICKVRVVCADCNKSFGRAQELARHKKDVHEQRRNCLFSGCGFKWARPSIIKAHLFAKHSEKFTADHLITIQASRGRMMVAFLDAYN